MPTPTHRPEQEDPPQGKLQSNKDSRPTPDPTVLTTQQIIREVGSTREVLEAKIGGIDRVVEVLIAHSKTMRLEIGEKVDHLQALVEEKFSGTYAQLSQRDILAKELALATKTAVDAALQAAEKAVGKQNESNAEAIKKSEV